MLKKIVVPLDGSKLAECALPYAEELATGGNTEEVILVSVTERVQGYRPVEEPKEPTGQTLVPEAVGKMNRQAQRYLGKIAKALEAKGVKVRTEVLLGNPAEEIKIFVDHHNVDLIVIVQSWTLRSQPVDSWQYRRENISFQLCANLNGKSSRLCDWHLTEANVKRYSKSIK